MVNRTSLFLIAFVGLLALCAAMSNPIYWDEIAYRSILGTSVRNDFRRITIFPGCSSSFLLPLPVTWYPSALILEQLYTFASSPLRFRLISTTVGLLNCLLLGLAVSRRFPRFDRVSLYTVGLLFMGIFPFYLVLARPEGVVLLGVLLAVVVSRVAPASCLYANILQQTGVLLLFVLFVPIHPTVLFFAPVFGYALFSRSCGMKRRILGLIVFAALSSQAIATHSKLISCPENEVVSEHWGGETGLESKSPAKLLSFLKARGRNFVASLAAIEFMAPSTSPLRNTGITPPVTIHDNPVAIVILSITGFTVSAGVLAMIVMGLRCGLRLSRTWDSAVLPRGLYLILLASIVGGVSVQPHQYGYRLTFWVPLLCLLAAVSYMNEPVRVSESWERVKSAFFRGALLLSLVCFCWVYIPLIWMSRYLAESQAQPLSSGILSPSLIHDDLAGLDPICSSERSDTSIRTAVDAATYWHFLESRVHTFWDAITFTSNRGEITSEMLAANGVDQIVILCASTSKARENKLWIKSGRVCCIPASRLPEH